MIYVFIIGEHIAKTIYLSSNVRIRGHLILNVHVALASTCRLTLADPVESLLLVK